MHVSIRCHAANTKSFPRFYTSATFSQFFQKSSHCRQCALSTNDSHYQQKERNVANERPTVSELRAWRFVTPRYCEIFPNTLLNAEIKNDSCRRLSSAPRPVFCPSTDMQEDDDDDEDSLFCCRCSLEAARMMKNEGKDEQIRWIDVEPPRSLFTIPCHGEDRKRSRDEGKKLATSTCHGHEDVEIGFVHRNVYVYIRLFFFFLYYLHFTMSITWKYNQGLLGDVHATLFEIYEGTSHTRLEIITYYNSYYSKRC